MFILFNTFEIDEFLFVDFIQDPVLSEILSKVSREDLLMPFFLSFVYVWTFYGILVLIDSYHNSSKTTKSKPHKTNDLIINRPVNKEDRDFFCNNLKRVRSYTQFCYNTRRTFCTIKFSGSSSLQMISSTNTTYSFINNFPLNSSVRTNLSQFSRRSISSNIDSPHYNKTLEDYIINSWKTDFPFYSHLNYKEIMKVVSRSSRIRKWYLEQKEQYQKLIQVPKWYISAGGSEDGWDSVVTRDLHDCKGYSTNKSTNSLKASTTYKDSLKDINDTYESKTSIKVLERPEVGVELFTHDVLPMETIIESLKKDTKQEQKDFLNDALEKFRIKVYRDYLDGKISSQGILDILFTK